MVGKTNISQIISLNLTQLKAYSTPSGSLVPRANRKEYHTSLLLLSQDQYVGDCRTIFDDSRVRVGCVISELLVIDPSDSTI